MVALHRPSEWSDRPMGSHPPHRHARPMSLKRWLTSAPATPRVSPSQLMPLAVLAGGFAMDDDDLDVAPSTVRHLTIVPDDHAHQLRPADVQRPLHAAS